MLQAWLTFCRWTENSNLVENHLKTSFWVWCSILDFSFMGRVPPSIMSLKYLYEVVGANILLFRTLRKMAGFTAILCYFALIPALNVYLLVEVTFVARAVTLSFSPRNIYLLVYYIDFRCFCARKRTSSWRWDAQGVCRRRRWFCSALLNHGDRASRYIVLIDWKCCFCCCCCGVGSLVLPYGTDWPFSPTSL